jgi:SAM-dependent methyltransferase
MTLDFWQFRQVGSEQWLAQPDLPRRVFVRLFGPLGVHARIRNARVINAINRLTLPPEAKILDAGCGHAYATFWLARRHPSCQFTALELDEKLVRDGNHISNHLGLKQVTFVQKSALEVAALSEYDLIFSIDLLEHIVDDVRVLCNFRYALRPGGWLLLHLPRRHQEHWRLFPAFKNHTSPDHVRDEYTAGEIRAKLDQAGFEVVDLHYGFSRWGELAFELNYFFWNSNILRTLTALIFHPISIWLAYMDTRRDYIDGNSLLVLARPTRIVEEQ